MSSTTPASRILAAVALITAITACHPVSAGSASTSRGQVSVTQARAMLDQARSNPAARQVLTAYLAGIGEAAGTMIDTAGQQTLACQGRLSLDDTSVLRALDTSAPDPARWTETAATPLILRDMLKRANCRVPQ